MSMQIHCPGCRTPLTVPKTAAGRMARCPVCKTKFTVPQPSDLLDETVCAWLASEIGANQDDLEEREGHEEGVGAAVHSAASAAQESAVRLDPLAGTTEQTDEDPSAQDESLPATEPARPAAAPPDSAQASATISGGAERAGSAADVFGAAAPSPLPAVAVRPMARPADMPPATFPSELVITGPRPHLVVLNVSQNGVRLAFDSIWLDHVGFRVSMPVQGIFSGQRERTSLLARPLVWADRSGGAIRSVSEIETSYQQHLMENWTIRDVINAMGIIDGLPRPFCYPMPYYVDTEHTNLSVACSTFARPEGGITCEVIVPHGDYALAWLRNVNGACGSEYEILERELALVRSDTWALVSEQVRQRLSVWCRFHPREHFLVYLNDPDLPHRDAGLAGLVVTNQRLIYHKFHHSGQIDFNEQGTLCIRRQGDGLHLTYERWAAPGHRVKLVKIHEQDLPTLCEALKRPMTLEFRMPA